jgi:hypothetical protein
MAEGRIMAHPEHRYPPLLVEENDSLGPPRSVWLFFLAIVIAQVTLISVVFFVDFTILSVGYFFIATWLWVLAGIVAMAGPAALAIRLRRARARRRALERAEWVVEDGSDRPNRRTQLPFRLR